MTRISIFLMLFLASILSQKIQAQLTITVTVENVASNKGKVGFALFNKDNFLQKPLLSEFSKVENGKSKITFKDIKKGAYAISCFHDVNNNNKMDFNDQGMPIEDYGVSNNSKNPYGPPIFEDVNFVVANKNVSLSISF